MLKVESEDRIGPSDRREPINHYDDGGGAGKIWLVIVGVSALLGAGIIYKFDLLQVQNFIQASVPAHDFSRVYASLGVKPLGTVTPASYNGLMKLERERCSKTGIYEVATDNARNDDKRWAADALYGFSHICRTADQSEGELRMAADYYLQLGAFRQSLAASDIAMTREGTIDATLALIRANAFNGLGQMDESVAEYERTQNLLGRSRTNPQVFFEEASVLERMGRNCDAAVTVKSEITSHPDEEHGQARTVEAMYESKCSTRKTEPQPSKKRAGSRSDPDLDALVKTQ